MSLSSSLAAVVPWWRPNSGDRLLIRGGRPLVRTYPISGAKNAVLPLMVSALLTPHLVTLHNVPANLDVAVLAALLQRLGCEVHWSVNGAGLSVTISANRVQAGRIDADLVKRMRASILLLGALLARSGEAQLPMPGGDAIGLRGVDFQPSVGATENLMLAAVLACGTTTIHNAAREPEVADLATCLNAMSARISGLGSHVLTIEGGAPLAGAVHAVLPDRIEFGTLACAAAITAGELILPHGRVDLLGVAAPLPCAAGVELRETDAGSVARRGEGGLAGIDVTTGPYPEFATDLQAPSMALLATAKGASAITETIFEQRFRHVDELRKMGANVSVMGRTALVRGVDRPHGATVTCTDVRAGAALVIAALGAAGQTMLDGLDHLDRGYDRMTEKLAACAADITRRPL